MEILDYLFIIGFCFGWFFPYSEDLDCDCKGAPLFIYSTVLGLLMGFITCFLYTEYAFSYSFFLYSAFYFGMTYLATIDYFSQTVDDRIVIISSVICFALQYCLNMTIFALYGAISAFIISGLLYLRGRSFYRNAGDLNENIDSNSIMEEPHRIPILPFLFLAVIIHSLSPKGLDGVLYQILFYLQNNFILNIMVILLGLLLLYIALKRRSRFIVYELKEDQDKTNLQGFGDGDVTISILIGIVFGWSGFLAIFWTGLVFKSLFGVLRELFLSFFVKRPLRCHL